MQGGEKNRSTMQDENHTKGKSVGLERWSLNFWRMIRLRERGRWMQVKTHLIFVLRIVGKTSASVDFVQIYLINNL